MPWGRHGTPRDVLSARYRPYPPLYPPTLVEINYIDDRNVVVISGMMGFLLIPWIIDPCARHANMSDSFDK
jgi:hypothetical protein